ncbi:hypothetical protein SAMN04488558_101153 [Ignavigranum ruoffiae]|uniref:Uncharacterized protein n=1 Tax=Ignavigranum ruoffiae TaxID=89093 RepID=A0A1H8Z5H3_9LACT|nr:hypothetical protein SAMN04488558_101153 [Ignavigranum ruoffiae]
MKKQLKRKIFNIVGLFILGLIWEKFFDDDKKKA